MNHFKKALKYLLSYIFIISLLFNYVIAEDDETEEEKVYFEEKSVEQIASGLFYEKTTRFTEKGFVDIHVLKVDLEDETLDLDILRSIENFGNKEKVTALVENTKNAVAGINASFFNTKLNPTNIVGTEYENQYITTQNNYNVNYIGPASLIKTTDNILFDYVESYIEVTNAHDIPLDVAAYNKLGNYTRPVIFDRTVIEHTNELEELNGLFKIAIEFGYVVNYKTPGEDIEVPNGGYIIVFPEIYNDIIVNSFDIGESVSVKIGTNLEEKMLEMVLSGGGKIIEKGKVVTSDFSVSPQSRHPRSAIGITEDQKYLIAMVVDGRGQSIGATHEELGQYLLAYGVYEGIHLDGGGSSTLVARNFGEDSIGIKNRPSDGVERKVANGLGFISNTTVGDIRKMKVEVDSNRVFINMPIAVSVSGVDENYNPVEIVPDLVTYSAKGIEGYFEDNIFYPLEAGKGSIICEYKDVKTTVSITAVDSYIDLDIQNKILFVDYLEEAQFLVNATDKDGFKSAVNPSNITYQLMNKEIGRFEEGVFIASEVAGMSKVILSANNREVSGYIVVGSDETLMTSFEEAIVETLNYPEGVVGQVSLSDEQLMDTGKAIQFDYDFEVSEVSQAVYGLFDPEYIKIEEEIKGLSLAVTSEQQEVMLRGRIVDASGMKYNITFANDIDFDGTKELVASIPADLAYPISVDRLYVVRLGSEESVTGSLVIDELKTIKDFDVSDLRFDHEEFVNDELLIENPSEDDFHISIFGATEGRNRLLDDIILRKIYQEMNDADLAIYAGGADVNEVYINNEYTVWDNNYRVENYEDLKIIYLATGNDSLVKTDDSQWDMLFEEINDSVENNILLIGSSNPINSNGFDSKREGELLHRLLSDYQNKSNKNLFFVNAYGYDYNVNLYEGIRYIDMNGLWYHVYDDNKLYLVDTFKMLDFYMVDGELRYQINDIYPKVQF